MVINESLYEGDCATWNNYLSEFPALSIFQSYEWGEYRKKFGWQPQRWVYGDKGKPVGLIQALVKSICFPVLQIIWIPGGPVFHREGNFANEIVELFTKKSNKSWFYYLRIQPPPGLEHIDLKRSGFEKAVNKLGTNFTIRKNLQQDLMEGMSGNWRHNLKRGRKNNFKITKFIFQNDIEKVCQIYEEMKKFKNLKNNTTYTESEIYQMVDIFKNSLNIWLCENDRNRLLSVKGYVSHGDLAYEMMAATSMEGRKQYAAHVLTMSVLEQAKKSGMSVYDVGGTEPEKNPGVHNFKKGTGGNLIKTPAEWEMCNSIIIKAIVNRYKVS